MIRTHKSSMLDRPRLRLTTKRHVLTMCVAAPVLLTAGMGSAVAVQGADNSNGPGQSNNGNNGNNGNSGTGNGGSINGVSGDGGQGHYAVTICHATRSAKNPYVVITVDASSISHVMSSLGTGHGKHTGPVFNPAVNRSGDNWGDIIPPVTHPVTGAVTFPGLNPGNLDWIARGCKAAAATTTTAITPEGSAGNPSTSSSSSINGGNTPGSGTTSNSNSTGNGASTETDASAPGTVPRSQSQGSANVNANANVNAAAPGTVAGSNGSVTVPGEALPGSVTLPAAVPAGDGSSLQQGLPSWALLLLVIGVVLGGASTVGLAMSRESEHLPS